MTNTELSKLIDGYKEFKDQYNSADYEEYRSWADKKQSPKFMIIACSDSRIEPSILTNFGLGDAFIVRNVANIVPPYTEDKNESQHGTSAALEFAVNHLKVEHIIILGHSNCGGVRALMTAEDNNKIEKQESFITPWVKIAEPAKNKVLEKHSNDNFEEQLTHCEKESLINSLNNLNSFPWIKSAIIDGSLSTHAWHFDIGTGNITQYNEGNSDFTDLSD